MGKPPVPGKPPAPFARTRRWVRRRIIVDAAFQFRMLIPIGLMVLVQAVLLCIFVIYPLYQSASRDPDPILQTLLTEQLLSLQVRLWPLLLFAAALVAIYTLVRSNRVAGPLYKLRQGLLRMTEGQYQSFRFRQGDELRDFEPVANRLAQRMESLSAGGQRKLAAVERRLKWLKTRLDMQEMPKGEIVRELEELLGEFSQVEILREG